MRVIALSLILIVFLSGCLAQYLETDSSERKTQKNTTEVTGNIPQPQVKTTQETVEETKVTTGITVEVGKSGSSEPKTFQVNVAQGIGVKEGTG